MEITSLTLMLSATLSIIPNRSQFFKYDTITLKCATPNTSSVWTVMRNTSSVNSESCQFGWGIPGKSSCTIEDAYPSDTGVYWCESQQGKTSNVINITVTAATLSIFPKRSQFFKYDTITLECATPDTSSVWTVMRNTSSKISESCQFGWGIPGKSSCTIEDAYPSDTGVYWCESQQGSTSNVVNITVTDGLVILESPTLPVTESDKVTLRCLCKENRQDLMSTSDFNATFYRDDVFIGTESAGTMILRAGTMKHEGFYKCEHPQRGISHQSWLSVKDSPLTPVSTPAPPSLPDVPLYRVLCALLLFVLYTGILAICVYMYRRWARARADEKRRVYDNLRVE